MVRSLRLGIRNQLERDAHLIAATRKRQEVFTQDEDFVAVPVGEFMDDKVDHLLRLIQVNRIPTLTRRHHRNIRDLFNLNIGIRSK